MPKVFRARLGRNYEKDILEISDMLLNLYYSSISNELEEYASQVYEEKLNEINKRKFRVWKRDIKGIRFNLTNRKIIIRMTNGCDYEINVKYEYLPNYIEKEIKNKFFTSVSPFSVILHLSNHYNIKYHKEIEVDGIVMYDTFVVIP